ncbi:RNA polymerase sigma factor [Polyangium sorediatum]|uniref:Sigma-70 family RNA polymerase sigma factor n=1 Tax=Polyangium sorediatum TaxID=889274 RepID=A0ABT6PAL4_9BACT|nr:sigma-70 family RNA polymerase sigma factor [Polyangium sorediatum]MDI1437676.1 sigma-70 family RNA polymerase sigma factor [Polyangium sorediatum]
MTSLAHVSTDPPSGSRLRFAVLAALRPVIFAWTGRWVSSPADRDDITHEVIWRAATSRTGADVPDDELRPWLFVITARMACKYLRREQRHASRGEVPAEDIVSPNVSPEVAAERAEFLRFLQDELAKLTPRQRAAFIGYDVEEKSHETIARSLGISTASAKNAAFQARMRLYAALCERDRDRRGVLPLLLFFLSGRWWRGSPGGELSEGSSQGRLLPRLPWSPDKIAGKVWAPLVGMLVGAAATAAWLLPSDDAPRVRHLHLAPYVLVLFRDQVQEPVAYVEPPAPAPAPDPDPAPVRRAPPAPAPSPTLTPEAEEALDRLFRGVKTYDPKEGQ